MKINGGFKGLIDTINRDLDKNGFVNKFRETRKRLACLGKSPKAGILFKYSDTDRDWAINEGGGIEIQFQIFFRDDKIGYGIGFNAQYVQFKNEMSPKEYIRPFTDAYLRIKDSPVVTKLKDNGMDWIYGTEKEMANPQNGKYYLFGKIIPVNDDDVADSDYNDMLSDLQDGLFNLYTQVFESRNKYLEKEKNKMQSLDKYHKLLRMKKNLILQGAPGTGKTYMTMALAVRLCNPSFDDYDNRKNLIAEYERLRKENQIAFCTFHQSMDYEDFIEGLKPNVVTDSNNQANGVVYSVEDGIFKRICKIALDNQAVSNAGNNMAALYDSYCKHLNDCLTVKKATGDNTGISLLEKSKMRIQSIKSPLNSIVIGQDGSASSQFLSKSIFLRDYNSFLNGGIKSYRDIKPAYSSESDIHGNAIYYFALFQRIKKFSDTHPEIKDISSQEHKNYVLIIDEINRGNVSRIFGELITLLEADKRISPDNHDYPVTVKLPYSGKNGAEDDEEFGVPDNLYIIGTQNTTDRSTGSIDYAVRRRFAFVTLPSSVEVLQAWYEDKKLPDELKASAVSLFKEINGNGDEDRDSFIAKHKTGDFDLEDLKVGHSYFMAYDFDSLRLKMEFEVVPLLREYIKDGILADHQGDTELFSRWIECTPKISVQDD